MKRYTIRVIYEKTKSESFSKKIECDDFKMIDDFYVFYKDGLEIAKYPVRLTIIDKIETL